MLEQINDLKANNKLLLTDVLPNLVNNSDVKTLDFYNKMDNKVNTLASEASQKFNFLFNPIDDDVGDWKETRQMVNPVEVEQKKYETNPLSNKSNSYDMRNSDSISVDSELAEDLNFYNQPSDIIVDNDNETQTQDQEKEQENEPEDMFGLDNETKSEVNDFVSENEDPVFIPEPKKESDTKPKKVNPAEYKNHAPEYKRFIKGATDTHYSNYQKYPGESKTEFRYRADYFYNKENDLYVAKNAIKKHDDAYSSYLRNKPLI